MHAHITLMLKPYTASKLLFSVMLALSVLALTALEPAAAGNCNYSYQHAKTGSACGARAKSARKASSYAN